MNLSAVPLIKWPYKSLLYGADSQAGYRYGGAGIARTKDGESCKKSAANDVVNEH